jgi:hypothetical protein
MKVIRLSDPAKSTRAIAGIENTIGISTIFLFCAETIPLEDKIINERRRL